MNLSFGNVWVVLINYTLTSRWQRNKKIFLQKIKLVRALVLLYFLLVAVRKVYGEICRKVTFYLKLVFNALKQFLSWILTDSVPVAQEYIV